MKMQPDAMIAVEGETYPGEPRGGYCWNDLREKALSTGGVVRTAASAGRNVRRHRPYGARRRDDQSRSAHGPDRRPRDGRQRACRVRSKGSVSNGGQRNL